MAKKETTSTTTTGVAKLIKVRHRYNSSSGYSSGGGEDLDDEEAVNSYHYISESSSSSSPSAMKVWLNRAEIFLWVASALFIFYLGDFQSNFFTVILRDPRIKRVALNIGLICLVSNIGICLILGHQVKDVPRIDDKWEILAPCVLPVATVFSCVMANLELFNIASLGYTVYGIRGCVSIYSTSQKRKSRHRPTSGRLIGILKSRKSSGVLSPPLLLFGKEEYLTLTMLISDKLGNDIVDYFIGITRVYVLLNRRFWASNFKNM